MTDALLFASFGGPEGPDDVMPFLENVTRGRGVPRERLEEVSHHYLALGGVSPINDQNRALITALETELAERGVTLPIYWGNRNWAPYMVDAIRQIHADGHRDVLALATSAYSSYSGCRQYREDFASALIEADLADDIHVDKVRAYFDSPGFLLPFADGIVAAIRDLQGDGVDPQEMVVLFTTHSIPNAMAESSGPPGMFAAAGGAYEAQHLAAAGLVEEMVNEQLAQDAGVAKRAERPDHRQPGTTMPRWRLTYQSRSGPPQVPWLEPDINDALREEKEAGAAAAIIVPLGFISDHVEVIWDLDNEAAETCEELGLPMRRVATPGIDPRFVSSLADLIVERLGGAPAPALSDLGPWAVPCAAGCCRNLRAEKPHVAGVDSSGR